ncbi:tryptophan--tRNA ligase [Patescibacteria group bacterium]|nr:tryptophan--tRNA ligase [Patescibacteria group bacterium]MBU1895610.1 tryptophan--tRNA ligase [Patescibacteria group bacterium]
MTKKIIISGIQPTGNLHIGNYLGAVKNFVDIQNQGDFDAMYIFIADLHSLTGGLTAKERHENIIKVTAEVLACGINPNKITLFAQSHVVGHTELGWIFDCVTPIAELERMTQFKDKSSRQEKNINAGLLTYPALMSADILMYHATHVPVGEDQIQHVELTRIIGKKFNTKFGKYFPETKVMLTKTARVMSLLEPNKKMSKSLGTGHVIELADEPKVIEGKIKKAVTATEGGGKAPGVENLLMLLNEFGDKKVYNEFSQSEKKGDIRYGDLKSAVSTAVGDYFKDFRERRKELLSNHDEIAEILMAGAEKAQAVADKTMDSVRRMVGIR